MQSTARNNGSDKKPSAGIGKVVKNPDQLNELKQLWWSYQGAKASANAASQIAIAHLQDYQKYESQLRTFLDIPQDMPIKIDLETGVISIDESAIIRKIEPTVQEV